jgi:F-type H+-transporting ATPase subunit b
MLSIDPSLLVVFLIVWILLFVLKKIFFKPLTKVMEKRNTEIGDNQRNTEAANNDYEQIVQKIEEDLKSAREAARKSKIKLQSEALKEKEQILAEISKESRGQVQDAKEKLEKKIEVLKKDLESQSDVFAKKIEKRLLH